MVVGSELVAQCIGFAREAGYRKVVLWTYGILHSARRIYERAGFKLVRQEKHHSFGHDLVAQTFEKMVSGTIFTPDTIFFYSTGEVSRAIDSSRAVRRSPRRCALKGRETARSSSKRLTSRRMIVSS
jgi:hypothetical protein